MIPSVLVLVLSGGTLVVFLFSSSNVPLVLLSRATDRVLFVGSGI